MCTKRKGGGNSGTLVIVQLKSVLMLLSLQALMYIPEHSQTSRNHLNDATGTLTPYQGPDTMLNQITLSNSTAGKCAPKTTRTRQSFNQRGTKMLLLSDELRLITNNSKRIANGGKLISLCYLPHPSHLEKQMYQGNPTTTTQEKYF